MWCRSTTTFSGFASSANAGHANAMASNASTLQIFVIVALPRIRRSSSIQRPATTPPSDRLGRRAAACAATPAQAYYDRRRGSGWVPKRDKGMRILVTGAAGFIGAALSQRLLARGNEVLGFDNLNAYYDVSLKHARLEQI